MKKSLLSVFKTFSFIIGVLGLLIAVYGFVFSTTEMSKMMMSLYFGVPGILFIILSIYLRKKYKRDYPKSQEQIEAEQRAKDVGLEIEKRQKAEKKEARQKKIAEAKERREIQKRLEEEKKAAEERAKQEKIEENLKKEKEIKNTLYNMKHVSGLPLSEGSICSILYSDDQLIITGGGNNFHLSIQKITDICIKTDTELQKSYVSSVGGAVGGAVLFGTLGAMIGGRAKEKTITTITNYLIITYIRDNDIDYIGFEIEGNLDKVREWIERVDSKHELEGKDIVL